MLYPKEDTLDMLKNWLEHLHNFSIRHKGDFDTLNRIGNINDPRVDEIYDALKEKSRKDWPEETIDFDPWPVPASGEVSNITIEEFKRLCVT